MYDPRETKIRIQIRTRDPDGGVLMFNAGSQEGRYSLLEVQGLYFLEFSNVYYVEINTRFGLSIQKYVFFKYKIEQNFICFLNWLVSSQ